MYQYVSSMERAFKPYISTAIVKMAEAKGQMSAVTGQARELCTAYANSEIEAAGMQQACASQIYQLRCFAEQEVAFKQDAVARYHILNESSNSDLAGMETVWRTPAPRLYIRRI